MNKRNDYSKKKIVSVCILAWSIVWRHIFYVLQSCITILLLNIIKDTFFFFTTIIWLPELIPTYLSPPQDFCALEPPFIPTNLSRQGSAGGSRLTGPLFVPLPNSTALGWASNVTAPPAWPPLSSLRLLVSQEGQSCVEACHSAGFICEPAHFRFINNKEALHG